MSFSVLMSVYFKEKPKYLEVCLQSLAEQTLKADEVVLVEDGPISSDLKAVIERFRESLNIVSVPLDANVGLAEALNAGLKHCSYELIARMDTDDFAMPERFERQVSFMNANPDVGVCGAQIEEMNELLTIRLNSRTVPIEHPDLVKFMKGRAPFSHPVVIFRKSQVLSVGGYPSVFPEDYLLWVKLYLSGCKFHNLPDFLLKMRTGDNMLKRRDAVFLIGILKTYTYMYHNNVISIVQLLRLSFGQVVVRLSPFFIRKLFYKYAR